MAQKRFMKSSVGWKVLLTFIIPMVVLVLLVVAVVTIKRLGDVRQKAAHAPINVPKVPMLISDNFSSNAALSAWKIIKNPESSVSISTAEKYGDTNSLLIDYKGKDSVLLDKSFTSTTNTNFRIAFKDDGELSKGAIFGVLLPLSNTEMAGLGVMTNVTKENYVYRFDTASSMKDSGVKRTPGWHLFEVVVTDQGTFFKIDNNPIYDTAAKKPIINTKLNKTSTIRIASSWNLFGRSWFSRLEVIKMDSQSGEIQALRTLGDFFEQYRNTNFTFDVASGVKKYDSTKLRDYVNTVLAFHTLYQRTGNEAAKNKSLALMTAAVNPQLWIFDMEPSGAHWIRGATLSVLATTLKQMKGDLLASEQYKSTYETGKKLLFDQMRVYTPIIDSFDRVDSKWEAYGGSSFANGVSAAPQKGFGSSSGLVLNYTQADKPIYIRRPISIYPLNHWNYYLGYRLKVKFYDQMQPSIASQFGIYDIAENGTDTTEGSALGVDTGISKTNYVFRMDSYTNTKDTGIPRTPGWHTFELITGNGTVRAYIDNKKVPFVTPKFTGTNSVYFVSAWNKPAQAIYDDLEVTWVPISGYLNDSRAEENGWNANALAEVVNSFEDIPHKALLEEMGKCFAYHTLTTKDDPEYCRIKTQTLLPEDPVNGYKAYTIANHKLNPNPSYHLSAVGELVRSIHSFKKSGKPVPIEYEHNLEPVLKAALPYIDTNTCLFQGANVWSDWPGATGTPYQYGLGVLMYGQARGWAGGLDVNRCINLRNVTFYGIANSNYVMPPSLININDVVSNPKENGWFFDNVVAGEAYSLTALY